MPVKDFTILIEKGIDGYYIAEVLELPGCHTQAKDLDVLMQRIREALKLYLEVKPLSKGIGLPEFFGIHKLAVNV